MTTISRKLDSSYLYTLEHSLRGALEFVKPIALPMAVGTIGAGICLMLLSQGLLPLLFGLALVSSVLLIATLTFCLHHFRQQQREQELLLAQNEQLAQEVETLRQSDAAKSDLLCVLGHDLRSPFATLKNIVWLLEQNLLDPEETSALLPRVRLQIEGLYSSLDNVLIWSRKQSGEQSSAIQPVPVAAIAREIAGMYHPAAQQKELILSAPEGTSVRALMDPDDLRLILRNLLDNAVKFTPVGGQIAIDVQSDPQGVLLRVQDSGIGMNSQQLAKIFSSSNCPDCTHVRKGTAGEKGIGLGLQLCRSYIQRYGGQMTVSSQPGQGTRFEICLPAAVPASVTVS